MIAILKKMTELAKLRLVFQSDCIHDEDILYENFSDGTAMTRKIVCDGKLSYLVVRLDPDRSSPLFPYFKRGHDLSRICDYFIFVEYSDEVFVLLIEFKRGYDDPKPQLNLSDNFIKFVLRRMCLLPDLRLEKPFKVRKIGVTDVMPPKQRTKVGDGLRYDENNYIKRYRDDKIKIETLIKLPATDNESGHIILSV